MQIARKHIKAFVLIWICSINFFPLFTSTAFALALSVKDACNAVVKVALNLHLATENANGHYYCVPMSQSKEYFIFQLHYGGGEPKDWVGSDLLDYYAVRKSDASVLEWDINNNIPGKIIFNSTQKGK